MPYCVSLYRISKEEKEQSWWLSVHWLSSIQVWNKSSLLAFPFLKLVTLVDISSLPALFPTLFNVWTRWLLLFLTNGKTLLVLSYLVIPHVSYSGSLAKICQKGCYSSVVVLSQKLQFTFHSLQIRNVQSFLISFLLIKYLFPSFFTFLFIKCWTSEFSIKMLTSEYRLVT